MDGTKKYSLVLFAIMVFAAFSYALPIVGIYPADENSGAAYPFEKNDYNLVIYNPEQENFENLKIRVYSDSGLRFTQNIDWKTELIFEYPVVLALEKIEVDFTAKPIKESNEKLLVNLEYGADVYSHRLTTYLDVEKNPLQIGAELKKNDLSPGEQTEIVVSLKNVSDSEISNINIFLKAEPEFILVDSPEIKIEKLQPAEERQNLVLKFSAGKNTSGKKNVSLLITYLDKNGRHELVYDFPVDVKNKDLYLAIVVVVVVLLVGAALYLKYKKPADKIPEQKKK